MFHADLARFDIFSFSPSFTTFLKTDGTVTNSYKVIYLLVTGVGVGWSGAFSTTAIQYFLI